ncbi:aminoacyl-tRNA hydrolase [Candidatus Peregrinibacteria bacterium]|nr:aminoacyl-tRNA hydrolase [Candidatus Peregrinibacteria bacterium]
MKPSLILIGLGNPGASYERTRHNVGFQAIDRLSEEFGEGPWQDKQKFQSVIQEGRIITAPILLVKPQTYMNRSGEAVRKLVDFYKLNPGNQVLVFCDDIDLPLGEVRLRRKGGPGTHNGLRSIVELFGEGFPRARIGLGDHPTGEALAPWVLSIPPEDQKKVLTKTMETFPELVKKFILEGEQ